MRSWALGEARIERHIGKSKAIVKHGSGKITSVVRILPLGLRLKVKTNNNNLACWFNLSMRSQGLQAAERGVQPAGASMETLLETRITGSREIPAGASPPPTPPF